MKTALDTSVILDVVTNDTKWADVSEAALAEAFAQGSLVIGECVLAEITPAFKADDLERFLKEWRILYLSTSRSSAMVAGRMYQRYLIRSGKVKRVLPDFLIGAHALEHTGRLLARDRGYYQDYFKGLEVIDPSVA